MVQALDLRGTPGKHTGPHFRPSVYSRFETDLVEKQRDQGPSSAVGTFRLLGGEDCLSSKPSLDVMRAG